MKQKKVLFITQEMTPFTPDSHLAQIGRYLPQYIQEKRNEIRIFTPKWGSINERRNQLHEVIRLSGMNLIIDETDHPLIIKVASLQAAHMQIYFIDNDDYFMKRQMITDADGFEYSDNGERAIFYARGVLETVKKLRWEPSIVHCTGFMTALAPLYIKKAFNDEPSFCDSKVIFSLSSKEFNNDLGVHARDCIPFKGAKLNDVMEFCREKYGYTELAKLAIRYSDGVIVDSPDVDQEALEYAKSLGLPILEYTEMDNIKDAYNDFYDKVLEQQ
ncbi:MAG: glycogen/starch synthase [Bacteroidaceae bacterium]|nr:glycogen/starch synthase [Bacteroidaceae bacterium]